MKVALISGASGGIGRETAKFFIKNGYFVIGLFNNDGGSLENLKDELKIDNLSDYLFSLKCDLNNSEEIYSTFNIIKKNFKHIDVLINNAGIGLYKLVQDTLDSEWDKVFNINVKATFILSKLVIDGMIERQSGSIVNVSSIWGQKGASMESCYSASKSAVIGFTKALAQEVGPSNIRVNCVCPGVIDTKMNKRFTDSEMQDLIESTPLSRIGNPVDIAKLIYFLSNEESSFITGQIITADGGFTL